MLGLPLVGYVLRLRYRGSCVAAEVAIPQSRSLKLRYRRACDKLRYRKSCATAEPAAPRKLRCRKPDTAEVALPQSRSWVQDSLDPNRIERIQDPAKRMSARDVEYCRYDRRRNCP